MLRMSLEKGLVQLALLYVLLFFIGFIFFATKASLGLYWMNSVWFATTGFFPAINFLLIIGISLYALRNWLNLLRHEIIQENKKPVKKIISIGFLIFSPLALLLFTAEIYSLVFSQFQIGPFYGYEPE